MEQFMTDICDKCPFLPDSQNYTPLRAGKPTGLTPCDVGVRVTMVAFVTGARMPFDRRQDSWIIVSGSTDRRDRTAATATNIDDPLSEFTSETPPPAIVAPDSPITTRAGRSDVTASATRIQNSTVERQPANPLPTRSRSSRQTRLIESLTAHVQELRTHATKVQNLPVSLTAHVRNLRAFATKATLPLWIGPVPNLRPLQANTALVSFAGGIATGALVMWLASASPPPIVVPSATPPLALDTTASRPHFPGSSADAQSSEEDFSARSTLRRSPLASTAVGTIGRRDVGLNRAVSPSRAGPAASVKRSNASPSSYRGSLALRSAPQGARVFVNGALVGSTPLVLENLPVGSRAVRIEADGYERWSTSTQVVANQQTHVSATLARAAP